MKYKLTVKQSTFIDEYLVDLNATQAAIRAGYSKKTAKVIGSQNLTKLNIQVAIKTAMDARAHDTGVTSEKVIRGISEIAFAELGEDIRASDKLKGLELLCKHLGLFNDNSSLTPGGVHITMNYGPPEGRQVNQGKTIEGQQV